MKAKLTWCFLRNSVDADVHREPKSSLGQKPDNNGTLFKATARAFFPASYSGSGTNNPMIEYSRVNPSPRYQELLGLYKQMHTEGAESVNLPPEKTFPGLSLKNHVVRIGMIIEILGSETILDYGSGKGKQYGPVEIATRDGRTFLSIKDFWRVSSITCFDPAYEPFSVLPEGKYDGVVSTDVLEHCPKEDVPWIINEMFSYAREFVFMNVACYPAVKTLPNGENAHCTVEPVEWWKDLMDDAVAQHPGLRYYAEFSHPDPLEVSGKKHILSFVSGKHRER